MRTPILVALLALALAGLGCNKDSSPSGAALDAQGAAKSARGHHLGKHGKMAEGKMHAGMHGKMDGVGPMDPKEHAAKMTEALGLDADQSAQVEKLFADFAPRQQALRDQMLKLHQEMSAKKDDGSLDDQAIEAARTAMAEVKTEKEKLHQEIAAAMDAILTPEQKAKHQQLMADHAGGEMGHHCDGDCDHAGKGDHPCNGDCECGGDQAGKDGHHCDGDCDHAGKKGDSTCPHADKMGDGTCPHATEGGECPHKAEHHPNLGGQGAEKAAAE